MFDDVDREILAAIEHLAGAQKAEIVKFCRKMGRHDSTIERRIRELDIKGAILQDKTSERGRTFISLTHYGREVLAAGRDRCPTKEAEQHD